MQIDCSLGVGKCPEICQMYSGRLNGLALQRFPIPISEMTCQRAKVNEDWTRELNLRSLDFPAKWVKVCGRSVALHYRGTWFIATRTDTSHHCTVKLKAVELLPLGLTTVTVQVPPSLALLNAVSWSWLEEMKVVPWPG